MLEEALCERDATQAACETLKQRQLEAIAQAQEDIRGLNARAAQAPYEVWSVRNDAEIVNMQLQQAKEELFAQNFRCTSEGRLVESELREVARHENIVDRLVRTTGCQGNVGERVDECQNLNGHITGLADGIREKKRVLEAQQMQIGTACDQAKARLQALIDGFAADLVGKRQSIHTQTATKGTTQIEADAKREELQDLFADIAETSNRCEQVLTEHDAEVARLKSTRASLRSLQEPAVSPAPSASAPGTPLPIS